ncbi:hypothetical protein B0H17DRAFT_1186975 [Mycena rosella]|uniref:Uncharacterized protein n=1 Tax=Mycena rosella TaxID=1033263 RepID=A0AAD7CCL1_MYCRO|nr:hypothetical protein B0H17DRAFT_1186975 [Mycena rosella]
MAPADNDPDALKVREWRHKLQKAFLTSTSLTEDEMPALDALFTAVEEYETMSIEYLAFSKIGKVMRHHSSPRAGPGPAGRRIQFSRTRYDPRGQVVPAPEFIPMGECGGGKGGAD